MACEHLQTEMLTAFTLTSTTMYITASNVCIYCSYFTAPGKVTKMKEDELTNMSKEFGGYTSLHLGLTLRLRQADLTWPQILFLLFSGKRIRDMKTL